MMIDRPSRDLAKRVRGESEPIRSLQWLSEIIAQLDTHEGMQRDGNHSVIDGTIDRLLHEARSWLIWSVWKMDWEAGEALRQALTQQIGDGTSLRGILIPEEKENTRSPIVIH